MTKEIEVRAAPEIESKNIEVGEWGLNITGALTPEEWHKALLEVQKYDGKLQWYLGDLVVYAEAINGFTSMQGQDGKSKYQNLIESTGYQSQTLKQYASVARRFTNEFRERIYEYTKFKTLSFAHFQFVASLEDNFAEYWLKRAAENLWGVARLREALNKEYDKDKVEKNVVQWRLDVKESLKIILDSGPEIIIIRSMKNGKVVAEETVEIPQN